MPTPRPPRDDDATILPLQRRRQPAHHTRWHVERIDTEPLTAEQHAAAVTALAALIRQWQHHRDNGNNTQDNAA